MPSRKGLTGYTTVPSPLSLAGKMHAGLCEPQICAYMEGESGCSTVGGVQCLRGQVDLMCVQVSVGNPHGTQWQQLLWEPWVEPRLFLPFSFFPPSSSPSLQHFSLFHAPGLPHTKSSSTELHATHVFIFPVYFETVSLALNFLSILLPQTPEQLG